MLLRLSRSFRNSSTQTVEEELLELEDEEDEVEEDARDHP